MLIRFSEKTELMGCFFEEGETYDVQERLATKYCTQMGIAIPVEAADEGKEILPNPMADYKFPEPRKRREESRKRGKRSFPSSRVAPTEPATAASEEPPKKTPPPEAKPEAAQEAPEKETEAEVEEPVNEDPAYAVKGRGGPWFDVIDTALGTAMNEKPLKKADAEELMNALISETTSATDGE